MSSAEKSMVTPPICGAPVPPGRPGAPLPPAWLAASAASSASSLLVSGEMVRAVSALAPGSVGGSPAGSPPPLLRISMRGLR